MRPAEFTRSERWVTATSKEGKRCQAVDSDEGVVMWRAQVPSSQQYCETERAKLISTR